MKVTMHIDPIHTIDIVANTDLLLGCLGICQDVTNPLEVPVPS